MRQPDVCQRSALVSYCTKDSLYCTMSSSLRNAGEARSRNVTFWTEDPSEIETEDARAITVKSLHRLLRDPSFYNNVDRHTMEVLQMRCADPERHTISYQELVNMISNKRTPSFRLAVDQQGKEEFLLENHREPPSLFKRMVRRVGKGYLTDDVDRQYFADRYTCCPPPLFVPAITLAEIGLFIYHCLDAGAISPNGPIPLTSFLIYRPDRRIEVWRFALYMFIHAGYVHLFFNMLVQVVVGIPLEMIHGFWRIMIIYMAGVLAGSLGTSVFDRNAYLVGASGGVYALLAAHIANVMLNYSHMEFGILKLACVLIIASADVGFAVWDRYSGEKEAPPVGYTAHLMGAMAGLTVGLVVLKNFEQKLHEQYLWWIALAVYMGCTVFATSSNMLMFVLCECTPKTHLNYSVLPPFIEKETHKMIHGFWRIMIIYMAGVLAGSLGTSVFDRNAYLVGASGRVYALLAAHIANVMLNYSHMEFGILKLACVLIIASADVGFAVWDRYSGEKEAPPVGYTAHLMGAMAGLTLGLVVLKNFEQKLHEQYLWWIALAVYMGCTVFAVCWNIFYY